LKQIFHFWTPNDGIHMSVRIQWIA